MVHEGQGLPLGLKALHNGRIVHPCFDQLQRDPAAHRVRLLGQPHLSHSTDAELANQPVRPNRLGLPCSLG